MVQPFVVNGCTPVTGLGSTYELAALPAGPALKTLESD